MNNMKEKLLLLCVMCFLAAGAGLQAQTLKLPDQPDIYSTEVARLLSGVGNPAARANGHAFDSVWTSGGFSAAQKQEIMRLSSLMEAKRFKPVPHLNYFYGALALGACHGLSAAELDNMLSTTAKVLEKQNTPEFLRYLQAVEGLFRNKALYNSNYSRLFADGGSVSFEYAEARPEAAGPAWGSEEQEKEEEYFSDWDSPASEDDGWGTDWSSLDDTVAAEENQNASESKAPVYIEPYLPPLEGAIIHFKGVNLHFVSNKDSVTLYNTSGSFMPVSEIFVGEGGKLDWTNAGLNPEEVYASLGKYSFISSKPELSAEGVKLTYKGKLSEPVEGVLEYKSTRYHAPDDAQYPRFKSYESNIRVNNLGGENLVYHGGFALMGNKIYSSSLNSGMASIAVKEDGKEKFIIKSKRFNLQDTLISAERSAVVIYHGQDSIYHPAVRSRYNSRESILTLLKDAGSFKGTPFVSSYFQMDITADMIRWQLEADSLDISILSGKNQVPALFESQEYFNMNRFDQLKGLYEYHPLQMVIGYARKINSSEFYVEDMARALRQEVKTMRGAIRHLMRSGYIDYDVDTDKLKIKRKGFHYVLSSSQRKDYDDLLIASLEPSLPNATLSLNKQELKVRGIDKFYISRAKDVYIEPTNDEITLLGNRNFVFNGEVHAGNFIFLGKKMRFDYDSFLIDMPVIDSIKFEIDNHKVTMKLKREKLNNQLQETSGVVKIDLPNNKSSRRDYTEYPIFNSFSGSTVYFDRKEILGGVYGKDVNFIIPPFEIDSLSSSDPASIAFKGTFSSGGIVPDFEETLKVLEDQSLGFSHIVPSQGYKLFGGSGVLYDTLIMDGKGLHSTGHIDYLTSTLYSKEFVFFEDSVLTRGYKLDMEQGVVGGAHFPAASVQIFDMKWYPKQDSMYIRNSKEPFQLFTDVATLEGSLVLNSRGLHGSGKLHTKGADVVSEEYVFNQRDFLAQNASFIIQSSNVKKPILAANDVQIAYDLDRGLADISSEVQGVAALEFPYAQFKTSIPKAVWNLEEKTVSMSKPKEFDLSKSYFYTTRKELDSLVFNAEGALYDIQAQTLNVSGIPYIKVADAKITPEDNKVLILENARIQDFQNAYIVMDTLNEYHHLDNGKIKIHSRNKFSGNATYRLVNAASDTFAIEFNSFELAENEESRRKKSLRTVSSGAVKAEDLMMISPGMLYRGKVTMFADKPALQLDGFVKLDLKNIPGYNTWIKYNSTGDQREIAFNFDNSVMEDGSPLVAGIYYDSKTNELYPSFVTPKRAASDQSLFVPAGKLSYDAVNNEYRIEEEKKKTGKSYEGRIFAYNENSGEVRFEGPLRFIEGDKKGVNITAAGLGKGSFQSSEFDMNAFMVFDFKLPASAEIAMGEDVTGMVQRMGIPQANTDQAGILYKIAEIVGEDATRSYEQRSMQSSYQPLHSAGPELVKSLTISGVKLKWSAERNSWYSNGKIGLSNVGDHDANALIDGFIEIRRTFDAGDVVNIFLQISPGVWYYFNYEGNRLFTFSSYDEYNNAIKDKSKAGKAKPGQYIIAASDIAETMQFVNRFRKNYYGIETPYELNAAPAVEAPAADAGSDDPFSTSGSPAPASKADEKDGF
jgi:hypothetical protein